MRKLFVLWLCGQGIFAFGQEVNKEFTKLLLNEQFDNVDKTWNTTFNADNLFIGQNGYYELYRLSPKSGYYVIANNAEEYSAFQVDLHLIFGDHKNKKQSAGVLMMAQSESSGGISVEINQKKEYRVVRIYKDKQVPLSGTGAGWKKAPTALTKGENTITVKTYDKVYDLYFNGNYIQSFTDIELNKGKLGLYIGPDSKARFDYLKVLGEEKKELAQMDVTDSKSEEESFTQIIVKLKDQINKREKEIDECKTKLKLCESGGLARPAGSDTAIINQRNKLLAKVTVLEEENEDLKMKVIGMEEEIRKLEDFKQGVEKGNENGDIIINLTNMVSNQKNTIDALEKMNKILNNENNSLFIETKELMKQLDKTTNQLTAEQQKNKLLLLELDSMKKVVISLQDSLAKKNAAVNGSPAPPEKELSEEEKLRILIEKEREERRKKKEEEELKRREEEEKQKNGGNGNG